MFEREITSFSKTASLQREPFLTMFYTCCFRIWSNCHRNSLPLQLLPHAQHFSTGHPPIPGNTIAGNGPWGIFLTRLSQIPFVLYYCFLSSLNILTNKSTFGNTTMMRFLIHCSQKINSSVSIVSMTTAISVLYNYLVQCMRPKWQNKNDKTQF